MEIGEPISVTISLAGVESRSSAPARPSTSASSDARPGGRVLRDPPRRRLVPLDANCTHNTGGCFNVVCGDGVCNGGEDSCGTSHGGAAALDTYLSSWTRSAKPLRNVYTYFCVDVYILP